MSHIRGASQGLTTAGVVSALLCGVVALGAPDPLPPNAVPQPGSAPAPQETQATDPERADPAPDDLALEPAGRRQAESLARLMQALMLENGGDRAKALAAYRRLLDIDPGHVTLALRVADELVRRGQTPDAVDILKNTVQAAPASPAPLVRLAELYSTTALDKPEIALRYARLAFERAPSDFDTLATLHRLLRDTDQPAEAETLLGRAEASATSNPEYWVRLGALLGELDSRRPDAQAALPADTRADRAYERALQFAGDDAKVLGAVADHFVLAGQIERAIPLYIRIVRLDPESNSARNKLVRSLLSVGQRRRAIEVLEEMIRVNPLLPHVYEALGQLLIDERDYARAADSYRQSLTLNPGQPATYRRAARLFLEIREHDRAVEILREARARFPDHADIAVDLAAALAAARRFGDALPLLAEILQRAEREEPELLSFQLLYLYAGVAYHARDWDHAARLYKRAIEIDPENAAPAYNDLGYMWVELGRNIDEAAQLIGRALELDPGNGAYHDSMGWLLFHRGRYREALVSLLKAAAAPPEDKHGQDEFLGTIFDHIGDTYMRLGDTRQALAYWQKAVERQPQLQEVQTKIENARQTIAPASNPPPAPERPSTPTGARVPEAQTH